MVSNDCTLSREGYSTTVIIDMCWQSIGRAQTARFYSFLSWFVDLDLDLTFRLIYVNDVDISTFSFGLWSLGNGQCVLRWVRAVLLDRYLIGSKSRRCTVGQ